MLKIFNNRNLFISFILIIYMLLFRFGVPISPLLKPIENILLVIINIILYFAYIFMVCGLFLRRRNNDFKNTMDS